MQLHADLSEPAWVEAAALPWTPSPAPGVERRRIARDGDEVARVTSLVRYAPGSRFPSHVHGGGEEILVLEGTFSDEDGHAGPGTWVRNGVGTAHAPWTERGCVLLVKLWWQHPDEVDSARVDTGAHTWDPAEGGAVLVLHDGPHDETALLRLYGGVTRTLRYRGGLELFVIGGAVDVDGRRLPRWGWVRRPGDGAVELCTTAPVTLYVKRRHLADPPPRPA